jgi:hypothetical protein
MHPWISAINRTALATRAIPVPVRYVDVKAFNPGTAVIVGIAVETAAGHKAHSPLAETEGAQ